MLIDADKLKAEINGIIKAITTNGHPDVLGTEAECMVAAETEALNLVLETIDTLQKELPTNGELDKAAEAYANGPDVAWVGTSALEYAFVAGAGWLVDRMMEDKK